ncbi:MAG: dethiobiotin synthase [Planctomycetota bacterium]
MEGDLLLSSPGLFVTGTDTDVGKTVVGCAIARALRLTPVVDPGEREPRLARVGVCKPIASGCRREREGLVNEDAEALAHFADTDQPLDVVNPVRFRPAVTPAEAERVEGVAVDWSAVRRSLETIDAASDVVMVEGAGGVLAPLSDGGGSMSGGGGAGGRALATTGGLVRVLDLLAWVGYPAVVVARAGLGTINHTAMTVALLHQRGLRVAGVVMNGYIGDEAKQEDDSMSTNRAWIERMTGVPVLATVPRVEGKVDPSRGQIDDAVLEAVAIGGPAGWVGRQAG